MMPNHRKSLTAARLSGAYARNPKRYKGRTEPKVSEPLGDPPEWLNPVEVDAWNEFRKLPWLNKSHRCLVGLASHLHARMRAGTLGIQGLAVFRQCLGSMGATPADMRKVAMQVAEDEKDDLLD